MKKENNSFDIKEIATIILSALIIIPILLNYIVRVTDGNKSWGIIEEWLFKGPLF